MGVVKRKETQGKGEYTEGGKREDGKRNSRVGGKEGRLRRITQH